MGAKKVYLFFIIFYIFLISVSILAFALMPFPISYPEGFFITPGDVRTEWIFVIVAPGIVGIFSCLIIIYAISPVIISTFIKILSKKCEMRIAPTEKVSSSTLFRKIWARSFILGFFVGNICFTLAGQEIIIEFMRSVAPSEPYTIPDVETLWQLAWIMTIPSCFIVVPVFILQDTGIIKIKKNEEFQFESVTLASSSLYKVIKGFAGLGFVYNLAIMIMFWVSTSIQRSGFDFTIIIEIISPLIAMGSVFPGVLLLESLKPHNRKKAEKILKKIDSKKSS